MSTEKIDRRDFIKLGSLGSTIVITWPLLNACNSFASEKSQIPNPDFKGEWRAPKISNPDYKGEWVQKQIENVDFDDAVYKYDNIGAVGFELWIVNKGSVFDNIYVGTSLDEAREMAADTWGAIKDKEDDEKKKWDEAKNAAKKAEDDDDEDEEEEEDIDIKEDL